MLITKPTSSENVLTHEFLTFVLSLYKYHSRKKLNPIYDGYQGPTDVVKTKGSSKPAQPHQQHGSPVRQCSSCSVKCLKSPCTTFLVILVVFLMVIAGVLIFMGKITTPGLYDNDYNENQILKY